MADIGLYEAMSTLRAASTVEPEVNALLEIPAPWGTACAIPLGDPVLGGHGPISRRPVSKLAFADRWGAALDDDRQGGA